jgi:voltage-gated sodium channel
LEAGGLLVAFALQKIPKLHPQKSPLAKTKPIDEHPYMTPLQQFAKRIVENTRFQNFIIFIIVLAGISIGLDTYEHIHKQFSHQLELANHIILAIFVIEIVLKLLAEGNQPWRYFYDGWNVFDFIIVAVAFLPIDANFVAVIRMLRLLRILRLINAIPQLRMIIGALLKSIPSMVYIFMLLILHFYVFGTLATILFSSNDPKHFGNLHTSFVTLFRIVTLEGWSEVLYINMYGCDKIPYEPKDMFPCTHPHPQPVVAVAFFITFIVTGSMIVLNLFIGVVLGGIEDIKLEVAAEEKSKQRAEQVKNNLPIELTVEEYLSLLQTQIQTLNDKLDWLVSHNPPNSASPPQGTNIPKQPTKQSGGSKKK